MKISLKLIYLLNLLHDSHQTSTAIPLGFYLLTVLVTLSHFQGQKSTYKNDFFAENEIFPEQMDGYS